MQCTDVLKTFRIRKYFKLGRTKNKTKKKRTFKHDTVDVKSMATSLTHGELETHRCPLPELPKSHTSPLQKGEPE